MKKRTISAVVLLLILVGSILINYRVFGIVMLVFSILGFRELVSIKYGDKSKNIEIVKLIGFVSLFFIVLNNIYLKLSDNFLLILPMLGLTIPVIFYNDSKDIILVMLFILWVLYSF